MLDRRTREIVERSIEDALNKLAEGIFNPSIGTLKAQKSKELGATVTPTANVAVPKILNPPSAT